MAEGIQLDIFLCKTVANPIPVVSTEQKEDIEELNGHWREHQNRLIFVKDTDLEGTTDNKEIIQKQLDDGENGVVGTEQSLRTSKHPVSLLIKKFIYWKYLIPYTGFTGGCSREGTFSKQTKY